MANNREIFLRMNLAKKLPSPPRMAMELVRLCHTESASLDDLTRLVEIDPALSATLLRAANTEPPDLTACTPKNVSIQRAAACIGKHKMVNLALDFSLAPKIAGGPCQSFNYERFWCKSLVQAVAATAIAKKTAIFDVEEIYACGLLASIGELTLATSFPKEYSAILDKKLEPESCLINEKNTIGLNRHEMTAELLHCWGLPDLFCQAAALYPFYPHVESDDETLLRLMQLLSLAVKIADIALADSPDRQDFALIERLADEFGIDSEEFPGFFDGVTTICEERGELLRIRSRKYPPYREIKVMDVSTGDYNSYQPAEKLTILAIDDDPICLQTMTQYLRGKNRWVLSAQSGHQGLRLAIEEKPDMIVTDWRMSDLDGLDLCKILRRTSQTEHIYIIILSGCKTDDELVQAFNAGADDYVLKPFSPKVLDARIRSGERLVRYHRTVSRDREIIQQYASQLSAVNNQLQVMAMSDALTGLANRRNAMLRIKDAVAEAIRFKENLSCIMIDIDHFKCINDAYGHDVGDIVLCDVAKIFSANIRGYDMVSRIGGEEFLVISRRSNLDEARELAERLRQTVAHHETLTPNGQIVRCTISCGVAACQRHYRNDSELLKNADRALYLAKSNGRNRVEVAD
jgi:diguanylate cyclase (GGDEF)-like protein